MVWQVELDEDAQVVVTSSSGMVTGAESIEVAQARCEYS